MAITHTDLDDPLTKNMNFKYGQKTKTIMSYI